MCTHFERSRGSENVYVLYTCVERDVCGGPEVPLHLIKAPNAILHRTVYGALPTFYLQTTFFKIHIIHTLLIY